MTLGLGVRFLTGYSVTTDPASRDRAEWPPHPARIFMAMAAAHFETGQDPDEAGALHWLEELPVPILYAANADERRNVTNFVPINDHPIGKKPGLLQSIPGWPRSKQPRTFPRVRPHDETVFLVWPDADANGHHAALERLCAKVTRIGHPMSLVQMWVADEVPVDDDQRHCWQPNDLQAEIRMRVFGPQSLKHLADTYKEWELRGSRAPAPLLNGLHRGYCRKRPELDETIPGTVWDPYLIVRRLEPDKQNSRHRRLDLASTFHVTSAMHKAVIAKAPEPVPEFIGGHKPDGSPTDQPHLAYLPLAFVGQDHATGHLMGLAIAVPAELDRQQRLQALAAVGQVEELKLGRLGTWKLAADDLGKWNLRPETWSGGNDGATQWATVTPIAFDKHAKAKDRAARECELVEMIKDGCRRIALPAPTHVVITPVSGHLGVPAAHEFPRLQRKDFSKRRHAHAILIFNEPVRGPIAVGAGRYRGYGFCRPRSAGEVV